MSDYYIINWEANNNLQENDYIGNKQNKFELCFLFEKKKVSKDDYINNKYNPNYILKYPININNDINFKNGILKINKIDFEKILRKNNLVDLYLSNTFFNKNSYNMIKTKINTNCNINICEIFKNLNKYKNITINIDFNCNENNCNNIILTF